MFKQILFISWCLCGLSKFVLAQDTFSIVAVDSLTGEVGSAGASCVDLNAFTNFSNDFLGELFPNLGAINTQAWYDASNQTTARNRMNMGDTPEEIINWLVDNDVSNQPELRQYGIVAMVNGQPQAAAHTGTNTDDYKGHIVGPNYAIQGNILLGQSVLDAMEENFLNEPGNLACKLMAALQGANIVGADTRCANNGTSSLFAFVKVAQPNDSFGAPSFVRSVRTANGDAIEPIDSLQTLFDLEQTCNAIGENAIINTPTQAVHTSYNRQLLTVKVAFEKAYTLSLHNINGEQVYSKQHQREASININDLNTGIYLVNVWTGDIMYTQKIVKW